MSISALKEQLKDLLIQNGGDIKISEHPNIIALGKENGLDLKQLSKLLQEAYNEINWEQYNSEKNQEAERREKLEEEIKIQEEQITSAPEFIDSLIQYCFADGIVEANELEVIFKKAIELKQNENAIARNINSLLVNNKYRPFPNANLNAKTLKDTLLSTNWYNEQNYIRITTTPPPPPTPFPWKLVITGVSLMVIVAASILYYAWYKPYIRDKNAERAYSMANDLSLRSSQQAGTNYNFIQKVDYGSEMLVYEKSTDWAKVKLAGKEGYVSTKYLLSKKDFCELNSIFGDLESKETIATSKCRRALLDYYTKKGIIGKIDSSLQKEIFGVLQNKEVWQVFSKNKSITPNTVIYSRITKQGSKFTDFGFLLKNINTNKRKFILYSFLDDETPVFVTEVEAPDQGDIISIKRTSSGSYEPVYSF